MAPNRQKHGVIEPKTLFGLLVAVGAPWGIGLRSALLCTQQ